MMDCKSRCVAVVASFLFSVSAECATVYDIQFLDPFKTVLGTGHFTTDPAASVCVEQSVQAVCTATTPPPLVPGVIKKNPLVDFSANIQGIQWGKEVGAAWWAAQGQAPGYQGQSRNGPSINEGSWFFGDSFVGTRTLNLNFTEANADRGSGTWSMLVIPQGSSGVPLTGTGNWVATVVPLPSSGLLLLSTLLASLWIGLKPGRSTERPVAAVTAD